MKSGGPWNLRGLHPQARQAAREAARRSGMSVGEWLNGVIQTDDDQDNEPKGYVEFDRDTDYDRPQYSYDDHDGNMGREPDWQPRDNIVRNRPERGRNRERQQNRDREQYRNSELTRERERNSERVTGREREQSRAREQAREREQSRAREQAREREQNRAREQAREREREQNRAREQAHEREREQNQAREQAREREQSRARERDPGSRREAARTRDDLGELHGRLDKLSNQLERITQREAAQRRLFSGERPAPSELSDAPTPQLTGAPAAPRRVERPPVRNRPAANNGESSVDQAVAEIAARQRVLDGETAVDAPIVAPLAPAPILPVTAEVRPAATIDLGNLEQQLRHITARIEELRPSSNLEQTISAIRTDLAEIARQLNEALPRRAVESLEIEIKALAERIDHSRLSGVDSTAVAGLERGLAEVRDALRGLTPAENLVGFDEAVKGLAQKLDLIAAKDDPAALQQLETAIGALRGIVSHVASNDALTKVAEDVRALAAKVDDLASAAVSGQAFAALETRLESLTSALTASTEAGHAVPHELEKLLTGLIEKLEWVQLTHTDHAALAHLEDRIAMLIKRFDVSDARLGNLEAVERGLADLLVHLEQMRGENGKIAQKRMPVAVDAIERDVAEIKQSERRTQDSLEAVQGTVEHVVDRLALIESDMRVDLPARSSPAAQLEAATPEAVPLQPAAEPMPAAAAPAPAPAQNEPAPQQAAARRAIDPNLPPDHPLEPGSAGGRSRPPASAADRIAASEAAVSSTKPPVIPDPAGKSNFIAAARRAAQVAAATPSDPQVHAESVGGGRLALPKKLTQRIRTLLVAGSAVIIVIFCLHIASRLFEDGGSAPTPGAASEKTSPTAAAPIESNSATPAAPEPTPPSNQSTAPSTTPGASPSTKPGMHEGADQTGTAPAAPSANGKTTALGMPTWAASDITGSLPPRSAAPASLPPTAAVSENLPATIGGPALRAAAMAGDPSAAYEVAMRFVEGRGVPQSDDEAARWMERAAKQGLAPAQFRLGTFYEKGTGLKKDLAAARDLYLGAANKGNGKAMHNLAVLYAEGINGPPDYRTAAHWFRKAADHGIPDSQYNLGILYARGIGVQLNFAESYKWFSLAANQGDKEAAKKRDEVAAKLDPQSLTAARLAMQTWTAEPQPEEAISVLTPPGGWDSSPHGAQAPKSKSRTSSAKPASDTKTN